jgi:hypothetical protein
MSLLDSETTSRIITSSMNGEDLTEKRMPRDFFIEEQTKAIDYFLEQSSDIYEYLSHHTEKLQTSLEQGSNMMPMC